MFKSLSLVLLNQDTRLVPRPCRKQLRRSGPRDIRVRITVTFLKTTTARARHGAVRSCSVHAHTWGRGTKHSRNIVITAAKENIFRYQTKRWGRSVTSVCCLPESIWILHFDFKCRLSLGKECGSEYITLLLVLVDSSDPHPSHIFVDCRKNMTSGHNSEKL